METNLQNNKTKVKMRFPNESYFEDVTIDMNEFKPEQEFKDETFGWYKNTYVSISKMQVFISMKDILSKYWSQILLGLVVICMGVYVGILLNREPITVTIEDGAKINALRTQVDNLNKEMKDLRIAYDNKQGEVITKIKYIKEENAKEISNLGKLNLAQRDSVWSSFEAPQNSI